MRRLYSTFAGGWPGAGLLLMRVVIGTVLIAQSISIPRADPAFGVYAYCVFSACCAVLLVSGLWTPFAGTAVALIETWELLALAGDGWTPLLVGTIGGALAMLGPGAWSVDARLFGWICVKPFPTGIDKR